jgi:probable rRNA maturation factor
MKRVALRVFVQTGMRNSGAPAAAYLKRCARAALADARGELVIRIVSETESAELNERFRLGQGPTNVLAFPPGDDPLPADTEPLLGDIAICAPVVAREAAEQSKTPAAHWAHMVVHGCLHLLGYDHLKTKEARKMEARERELLAGLGIGDPYTLR